MIDFPKQKIVVAGAGRFVAFCILDWDCVKSLYSIEWNFERRSFWKCYYLLILRCEGEKKEKKEKPYYFLNEGWIYLHQYFLCKYSSILGA